MDQSNPSTSSSPQGEAPSGDILHELRELGNNLRELLRTAWESEERKKLQTEIETGLNDLGATLSRSVSEFSESPAGKTLKADIEDLNQRIQTGEVEAQVHKELLAALRAANEGLKKAAPGKTPPPPENPA